MRELGKLPIGNGDPDSPDFDNRTLVAADGDIVEVRLPWALLGYSDPSSLRLLEVHPKGPATTLKGGRVGIAVLGDGSAGALDACEWVAARLRSKTDRTPRALCGQGVAVTRFRHGSALAALLVICCLGAPGAVARSNEDLTLLTTTLPTLSPGQTAWVSTLWRGACTDATSFELTASGPTGISISYPTNTGSYSSFYKQSTLLADDTDYASLKITVGDSVRGNQKIALTARYHLAPVGNEHAEGNSGSECHVDVGSVTRRLQVTLAVAANNGPTVELVTTSVGPVTAGTSEWVSVSYKANAPGVTNARLTVTPPAGATVTYPNNGTSTGFAADANLPVGVTDSASFKIDTGSLKPGSYTLGLDLAYGNGAHLPGTVALAVS